VSLLLDELVEELVSLVPEDLAGPAATRLVLLVLGTAVFWRLMILLKTLLLGFLVSLSLLI
jgi:hypothetical protein